MCTFNIALDDKVVNTARKAFGDDDTLTTWMEEQLTVLLRNYTNLADNQRKPHKHDVLMGVAKNVCDVDIKHTHLREKYGL